MTLRSRLILAGTAVLAVWLAFTFLRPEVIANAPPGEGPFVAFGDSLTEGVGAPPEGSYPAQLSLLLDEPILNRGVRGETAGQALRRLESQVLNLKPAVVFVCLGGNDILQRKDVEATFAALEDIAAKLVKSGAMVVLIGVEGPPLLTADFGSRFRDLARRHQCVYVPDILDGIIGRPELMADGVHPNAQGYARMADRIAKAVRPHLS